MKSLNIHWQNPTSTFILTSSEYPRLNEIKFLERYTPVDSLCSCLAVSGLSTIIVDHLDVQSTLSSKRYSFSDAQGRRGQGFANLKFLDLGTSHMPPEELHKFFTLISTPTTLHCALPGYERLGRPKRWIQMDSVLSPSQISQTFAPLSNSLVKLKVHDGDATIWPGRDGTQIDLSGFPNLSLLQMPSSCLFEPSPKLPRGDVRKILPPSLEELKVCIQTLIPSCEKARKTKGRFQLEFGYFSHFLYDSDELDSAFPAGTWYHTIFDREVRYQWLVDLIQANLVVGDHDCSLRKVEIQERISFLGQVSFARHIWEQPLNLPEICRRCNVELDVQLRRPGLAPTR